MSSKVLMGIFALSLSTASFASCDDLPKWDEVKEALKKARAEDNGGFNLDMWGSIVDRTGTVCVVAFTGKEAGDQWPGSRVIAAQKAGTANAFSLPKMAFSTAQLYSATQPGGFMYGIQHSNPVDVEVAYEGPAKNFGMKNDPMTGEVLGGVNVFGGGLALYNKEGKLVGALGVSGDSSCADHNIAWKTRKNLGLDFVPKGMSPAGDDNIVFLKKDEKPSGFKHPGCGGKEDQIKLPSIGKKS